MPYPASTPINRRRLFMTRQVKRATRNGSDTAPRSLVGEAGVGKSRLAYEFVHAHPTQGWLVLESASVSYGKATPYFPVIDLLKRYSHIEDHDDTRTIRAKVTGQVLTLDPALQDTVPALLSLLDALPEDSPFLKLDSPQRRQRTLDGLKRVLLRESQGQPLLLVCEDLHWIDSETQALLDLLVDAIANARVLLLVLGFMVFFSAYVVYAHVLGLGGIDGLPPLPEEFWQKASAAGGDESWLPRPSKSARLGRRTFRPGRPGSSGRPRAG